jgi:DNA-directed RNA polymerase subunit RPC12/RpoP
MSIQCPKCGYLRTPEDQQRAPLSECPECGVIYAKFKPNPKEKPPAGTENPRPADLPPASSKNSKLAPCRTCNREVSKTAQVCPYCGERKPVKPQGKVGCGTLIAVAVGCLFLLGKCSAPKPPPQQTVASSPPPAVPAKPLQPPAEPSFVPPAATVFVTAKELYSRYAANEVEADAYFKGKHVNIDGEISEISLDFTGTAILRLYAGKPYQEVHIRLVPADKPRAANFSKGMNVIATCQRVMLVIGSPVGYDCRL